MIWEISTLATTAYACDLQSAAGKSVVKSFCVFFSLLQKVMLMGKRKKIDIEREETDHELLPTCSICIQEYSNRTFLRPCYHSFCFTCIRHWINIASSVCPICRQQVESLVYNIDDEENTFEEYHLKDKGSNKNHDPPLNKRKYSSPAERLKIERTQIYKGQLKPLSYPETLPKYADFTIITPEHIPRVSICSRIS